MLLFVCLVALCAAQWPLPASVKRTGVTLPLCANFTFAANASNPVLTRGFARYAALLDGPLNATRSCVERLRVELGDADLVVVSPDVDESYTLAAQVRTATLVARTFVGALRGLETFAQLVTHGSVPECIVADAPRFPWRGLLVDTARHFLPVPSLLRVLDSMAFMKLNVLHLHLTDAESFPLDVPAWPLLAGNGAWNARSVYTREDLDLLQQTATDRGIRIVPE